MKYIKWSSIIVGLIVILELLNLPKSYIVVKPIKEYKCLNVMCSLKSVVAEDGEEFLNKTNVNIVNNNIFITKFYEYTKIYYIQKLLYIAYVAFIVAFLRFLIYSLSWIHSHKYRVTYRTYLYQNYFN